MPGINISASGDIYDAENVTDLELCLRSAALPYCGPVVFTVTVSAPAPAPAPADPNAPQPAPAPGA